MEPRGLLEWDVDDLAAALRIDAESVREYFTDGRRGGFLLERRIARELGYRLAPEGEAYDLVDEAGGGWEVRSVTGGGMSFCPSSMIGSGRTFGAAGFLRKLDGVQGYVVADLEEFPRVPYWVLPQAIVRGWWENNQLGGGTKVSRETLLQLIREAP